MEALAQTGEAGGGLLGLLPLVLISIVWLIVANLLAKEKGRDVTKWTVLGAIPLVNLFAIPYFIGAANLRLEKKIDQLLEKMEANN